MTFEELMGRALGHAEMAQMLLEKSTGAMTTSEATQIPMYLSMASTYALLAEAYARLASAQIVNNTSMNQMLPQGRMS